MTLYTNNIISVQVFLSTENRLSRFDVDRLEGSKMNWRSGLANHHYNDQYTIGCEKVQTISDDLRWPLGDQHIIQRNINNDNIYNIFLRLEVTNR